MAEEMSKGQEQFVEFVGKASKLMFEKSAMYMPPNPVLGGMPLELATFAETSRASGVEIPKLLLARMFEKLYRISSMLDKVQHQDNHNESIVDSCIDLLNYDFMFWQFINWVQTRDIKK